MNNTMSKERLVAFTDAVLAIIMTILVLELEKLDDVSWQGLWNLRTNFLAYSISFFWLGTMWVNLHRVWDKVDKVNNRLVWNAVVLLFFSSFFPYTTNLVANHFQKAVAQGIYGIVVLLVTLCNIWMYHELERLHPNIHRDGGFNILNHTGKLDVAAKLLGIILTLTVYPPAMMWAVLATAVFIVLPQSFR